MVYELLSVSVENQLSIAIITFHSNRYMDVANNIIG